MQDASDERTTAQALTARTEALELILTRLAVQWANDREEPRRAAQRLLADLLAGNEQGEPVADHLRRFGLMLDERLARGSDVL